MNEESYQFFKELEKRHLTLHSLESMLWKIEHIKSEYYSHPSCFVMYFFNLVDRYLQHNDRDYTDCYEVAFWLVFLCDNKIPMNENITQEMSHFLILFEKELRHLCSGRANLQSPDIEEAIKGVTFQLIQSQSSKGPAKQISKRKQCLLL
ncbi:MAG: hypothetical protein LBF43_01265 [Puniceicoccales bacterium]|nr:hypothetical protein [Puniceicoccales bacterium]